MYAQQNIWRHKINTKTKTRFSRLLQHPAWKRSGEAYDANKQTIYIAPKSKMESRAWVQIAAATLSGNSLRQTFHTHQITKLVSTLLRVAGVTAGLVESNGSLPPGIWLTSHTENRDQLRNPMPGNRVWATFTNSIWGIHYAMSWWRSKVVGRRSLTGELSLSCARPAADGWPLMWVNHPLQVSQLGQLSLSSFLGR